MLRDLRPVTRRFLERALLTPRYMIAALAVGAALIMPAASRAAVACGTGTFEAWLADFKTDAAAKGISQAVPKSLTDYAKATVAANK